MISRLKSLELHGYKTFASRMLFEFPADITAIVGPNGAGKSNVADSLRWVLGEQSYSLLRGRKTEDMIFAGSEQRPRASMASATITFDNEDGWLPIDFSEVSITRRAYRDGQNEYLLNGQRVRLKEISELLAKSGLAERTYTIIGQGLVDAALSLKPDERRRFFEEAAGIGLYRSRRDEALGRLDTTKRNLERVQDILAELEPRLRSLERQARRAQEYERVKADLNVLLRDWYGFHWHRAQHDLLHSREVFQAQEHRLEEARQRLIAVEGRVEGSRKLLQEVRADLGQWHTRSADLHRQRERISRNLAVMDERQRALLEQQQSMQSDQARLEEAYQDQQARSQAAEAEIQRLGTDLSEARCQVDEARKALQARQKERERAEQSLRETRRQLVELETRQVHQRAHQNELTGRAESLRKSQQSLTEAVASEARALRQAEERLSQAEKLRQQAAEDVEQAEEALQSQRLRIDELETRRRKSAEERAKQEAERGRLKAQLDVLEQAERSFSGLNKGARFVLESARKGHLTGKYHALSSQIEVPPEYETAVAAVLGEFLDGVLLDPQADVDQVLRLLEDGEKGRAILFPFGSSHDGNRLHRSGEDCFGVAADLVRAPDELHPLIDFLLGQVVIVPDRKAARNTASNLPTSARAVTLQGEVFWGSGVVVAGQDGRAGMIARPRQTRELKTSLEAISNRLEEIATESHKAEQELGNLRAQEKELERDMRQAVQRQNQAVQAHQKAGLELEQARQRSEWQRKQLAGMESQLQKTEQEIATTQASLEEIEGRIQQQRETVRERSRALAELPLDELQAQVGHWNTNVAVAERAVRDAENRLVEYRQALAANRRQHAQLLIKAEENTQALQQLEVEKNDLRRQEAELNEAIDALQKQIEPAEEKLETAEQDYTKLQGDQTSAQQNVTVAERYLSQSQLEMTRQREALDSLRRRVEDDFGLVSFEYTTEVTGQTPLPLGDMVKQLPHVEQIPPELEENINRQRGQLRRMGAINPEALSEYTSVKERFEFMKIQVEDLRKADADLRKVITELDELMKREFRKTFDAVAAEFKQMFTRLFGGGSARLVLLDEDNPIETGVDIEARLPGRREQGLALLSGGERSLTAVALIFSLLKVSPTPFCVMDEVDAMLDEANVGRFCELLQELSASSQFLLITHNRNTVQTAGVIYGVTMGRDSASQIISLKLDEISEDMVR